MKTAAWLALVLTFSFSEAAAQSATETVAVEVFQVLEIPTAVNNAVLVKTKGGYLLKGSLANSSEFKQLGLRYSLVVIDSSGGANGMITRNEGFSLKPYETEEVTFKTPIKLKLKGGERLVLMVEQLISTEYVWEVIKAKDALTAYLAGDYSATPRVLRVLNQVDPPFPLKMMY